MIKTITSIFAACVSVSLLGFSASQSYSHPLSQEPNVEGAHIKMGSGCGFAKSGSLASVVNDTKDKSVKVTIRKKWSEGIKSGQEDSVRTLAAGTEQDLGCTASESIPVIRYDYSVVGVEVGEPQN